MNEQAIFDGRQKRQQSDGKKQQQKRAARNKLKLTSPGVVKMLCASKRNSNKKNKEKKVASV